MAKSRFPGDDLAVEFTVTFVDGTTKSGLVYTELRLLDNIELIEGDDGASFGCLYELEEYYFES